jgi:hypothetical protein
LSEIIELFFGDSFFEMLSKETNLYYFQNQGKYDSSSKGLKWVDVSVAEMKKFFAIIILILRVATKKRQTKRLFVYRSISRYSLFRNIMSHNGGKPEGNRPLGRPRHRWVDNIKMDLREIGWDGVV